MLNMKLLSNHTWSLVPAPPNKKVIGCKWVCKVKKNYDGIIQRYNARLVAKGFHQVHGFDYRENFSLVVKLATRRGRGMVFF